MTVDLAKPVNHRITKVMVRCSNCTVPAYEELDDQKSYNVTTLEYLASKGGDGYGFINEEKLSFSYGPLDADVFLESLNHYNPIMQGVEERIIFGQSHFCPPDGGNNSPVRAITWKIHSYMALVFITQIVKNL